MQKSILTTLPETFCANSKILARNPKKNINFSKRFFPKIFLETSKNRFCKHQPKNFLQRISKKYWNIHQSSKQVFWLKTSVWTDRNTSQTSKKISLKIRKKILKFQLFSENAQNVPLGVSIEKTSFCLTMHLLPRILGYLCFTWSFQHFLSSVIFCPPSTENIVGLLSLYLVPDKWTVTSTLTFFLQATSVLDLVYKTSKSVMINLQWVR